MYNFLKPLPGDLWVGLPNLRGNGLCLCDNRSAISEPFEERKVSKYEPPLLNLATGSVIATDQVAVPDIDGIR